MPAGEDAALVVRVGERPTVVTAAGSAGIGSRALSIGAVDELLGALLPSEQLRTLHEVGAVTFDLPPPSAMGGACTVVAGSTVDDRWVEVRRGAAVPPGDSQFFERLRDLDLDRGVIDHHGGAAVCVDASPLEAQFAPPELPSVCPPPGDDANFFARLDDLDRGVIDRGGRAGARGQRPPLEALLVPPEPLQPGPQAAQPAAPRRAGSIDSTEPAGQVSTWTANATLALSLFLGAAVGAATAIFVFHVQVSRIVMQWGAGQ